MRRLPAKSGLKSGNRTPTGPLPLKYPRFSELFAPKKQVFSNNQLFSKDPTFSKKPCQAGLPIPDARKP
jgi:hypothetical protein